MMAAVQALTSHSTTTSYLHTCVNAQARSEEGSMHSIEPPLPAACQPESGDIDENNHKCH